MILRTAISIDIDKELNKEFDYFCKEQGIIKSRLIENLIKRFMDEKR